jgi:DNA-binding MarR family transcriptional regulator
MAKQGRKGRAKAAGRRATRAGTARAKGRAPASAKASREATLVGLVTLTSRLFARALHDRLVPHGVAPGQLAVLQRLWEGDGLTQAELARAVRVEQPTMARTLDRMARDGLIERVPSKEDRRAFNVRLTARGRQLRRSVEAESKAIEMLAVGSLKRGERGDLLRLLDEVVGGLGKIAAGEDA